MKKLSKLSLLALLGALTLTGCGEEPNQPDDPKTDDPSQKEEEPEVKENDHEELTIMSVNLDQGHSGNALYEEKVLNRVKQVNPDLLGVQEESAAWQDYLETTLGEYGYQRLGENRGGSFPEASGIYIKLDRFEILQSGTFWFGTNPSATSGYIASEWGAAFPRVCAWANLLDKYTNASISFYNAHLEYNHGRGDMNAAATETNNTIECRTKSVQQIADKMSASGMYGFVTGDFNFFRNEEASYKVVTDNFDDAWALTPDHQESCTFHNYGQELDPATRKYPYSPIDYILGTKGKFEVRDFKILTQEGTKEEDFDSDHFFVYAKFGYKEDVKYIDESLKVMSANLDQGHQSNSSFHTKVLNQIKKVNPDLLGVQEEAAGWQDFLEPALAELGYDRIGENRGGNYPEASGIYIKKSRFDIIESGTFWFGDNANAGSGYIASEWGAAFPRICAWAKLKDKFTNKDIALCNAHLEYNHAYGNMNDATATSNTIDCRKKSCEQVIAKMTALGVPGFFTGDLNSFRENEPTVYDTCTAYFDDAWANDPNAAHMCTFHNYGAELKESSRQYPYSPIDYIYSTKGMFDCNYFNIMSNEGTSENDFDSDHFFVYASFNYKTAE